nr:hypothetical protein [uncultured Allomuricauda sp.]
MIRIEDNCPEDLDQLALDHYLELIQPQNADGSYHRTQSLIGRISDQLSKTQIPNKGERDFWEYLLANHHHKLERIIRGRPPELQEIINEIDHLYGNSLMTTNQDYNTARLTPFGATVKKVFNYGNYRDSVTSVNNSTRLNVNYCPYCNMAVSQTVIRTNALTEEQRISALYQLDHFYPQSRHPYLAVSFFNLIPGCAPCNSVLKGEKDFNVTTHFNPFDKSFDDYFSFTLSSVVYSNHRQVSISLEGKTPHDRHQIEDFELTQRYNDLLVKENIFNIITANRRRSPAIRKSYLTQIRGLFGSLSTSKEDLLKSQGVPLESHRINDFQFGKLKRDVCIQLGLL